MGNGFEISIQEIIAYSILGNSTGGANENDGQVIGKLKNDSETRNPLITSKADPEVPSGLRSLDESLSTKGYRAADAVLISKDAIISQLPIPKRISHCSSSSIDKKESSTRISATNNSSFKNEKKLSNVLAPEIVEAKKKPKTYLERYREKLGVPTRKLQSINSPEGSTLSIFGDTSYEPITEVDSRPPTSTPRDDQSELSFYHRLINQPRRTRSCDVGDRTIRNGDFRSVSDYGLTRKAPADRQRLSYRPYSIRDYECLTVPRADRSLGPDPVEIREKWEKLTRRTQYGDLASSRNRQNVLRRSKLRKCKRTNVQKHNVEFSFTKDGVAGRIPESKNFGDQLQDQPGLNSPQIPSTLGTKKNKLVVSSKRIKHPKTFIGSDNTLPTFSKSMMISLEDSIGDSSLEDLQRRHQNEKRVMDLLINRTLLR